MLRLAIDGDGGLWPDVLQKTPGRGVYMCMQALCLSHLTDRHLQKALQKYRITKPLVSVMLDSVRQSLIVLCRNELARLRSQLEVGRDAVLRQMKAPGSVAVFMDADAGGALRRSIAHAVEMRCDQTDVWDFPSESGMATALGRGTAAVVAARSCPQAERLGQHCDWYSRLI